MGLNQERVIAPIIRAGYNGSGSTIAKGSIVKLKQSSPAYAGEIVLSAATTDPHYGVVMADILNGEFGDVQVGGTAIVKVGAAGLANGQLPVTSNASGLLVAAAANDTLLGIAGNIAALSSGDFCEVELTPGGKSN